MADSTKMQVACPPEFLLDVDKFINLANELANELAKNKDIGEVSAAILFAAGRYNSFNFLAKGCTPKEQPEANAFYTNEYRKAFESNLKGAVGPVMGRTDKTS